MGEVKGQTPLEWWGASRYTAENSPHSEPSITLWNRKITAQFVRPFFAKALFEGKSIPMRKMPVILLVLIVVLAAGGAGMLATWDIPAPVSTVEKVIPDERFPR